MIDNLNGKRFAFAIIAAFATIFIFDYAYHGNFMMPHYEATAHLWRPMNAMEQMMPVCIMTKLFKAILLTWIFTKYMITGERDVFRFGLFVGLLMGVNAFSNVIWLPIEFKLAGLWFAGETLLGVLVAFVVSKVYVSAPSA